MTIILLFSQIVESPNLLSQGYSTAPMPVGSPVLSGRGPRLVPSQTNSPVPSNQSPAPISVSESWQGGNYIISIRTIEISNLLYICMHI